MVERVHARSPNAQYIGIITLRSRLRPDQSGRISAMIRCGRNRFIFLPSLQKRYPVSVIATWVLARTEQQLLHQLAVPVLLPVLVYLLTSGTGVCARRWLPRQEARVKLTKL
jgi:hypothetical protein